MYVLLLRLHGGWRWVVIIGGAMVLLALLWGLVRRLPWAPRGALANKLFLRATDVQVLLGASLYLVVSPLTNIVLSTAGASPAGSDAEFFGVRHGLGMAGAFIGMHVAGGVLKLKRWSDRARYGIALASYSIVYVVMFSMVPWWRPWLRV
jgi:cell division protein FtsW (lipid II flippase)